MKTFCFSHVRALVLPMMGVVAALVFVPKDALAADSWLSCSGTLATKLADKNAQSPPSQPSARTLVYNDELSRMWEYSAERKTLNELPTESYTPQQIKWKSDIAQNGGMKWEGTLNRTDLSIVIQRVDPGSVMTWTEKCSPTSAAPIN